MHCVQKVINMKLNAIKTLNYVKNDYSDVVTNTDVELIQLVYEETLRILLDLYKCNVEHEVKMIKLNLRKDFGSVDRRTDKEMIDSVLPCIQSIYLDFEKNLDLLKKTI